MDKGYGCKEEILSCIMDGILPDVGFKDDIGERLYPIEYIPHGTDEKQRERLCILEHPFGTVKRSQRAYFLLYRGISKTTAGLGLTFIAYNMKRTINMMGAREIIEAIRGI